MNRGSVDGWPTPTGSVAQLGERPETWLARRERLKITANNGNGAGMPLTIAVQMWPTPTARLGEQRGAQAKRYHNPARSNDLDDAVAATGITGQLNPTWVEWLMGFPIGWTVCEPSGMPLSPRSRSGSAGGSSNGKPPESKPKTTLSDQLSLFDE